MVPLVRALPGMGLPLVLSLTRPPGACVALPSVSEVQVVLEVEVSGYGRESPIPSCRLATILRLPTRAVWRRCLTCRGSSASMLTMGRHRWSLVLGGSDRQSSQ